MKLTMTLAAAAAFSGVFSGIFLASAPAIADPVGKYTVRGTNPGDGRPYSGQVLVERTGDTYQVVWQIGGQTYSGTGIGTDVFLAVSYRAGNGIGLALYNRKKDGTWDGIWTYGGGQQIGTDVWTPAPGHRNTP